MYDNYNYPAGSDTPNAPWNQRENDPVDIETDITVSLVNRVIVKTTNYTEYQDEEGCDFDLHDGHKDIENRYKEQHRSIPDLLAELAKYIRGELAGAVISGSRKHELKMMLDDCQGWQVDNIEIEDYNTVW